MAPASSGAQSPATPTWRRRRSQVCRRPALPGSAIRTTRSWATAAMTPSTTRSTSTSTSRRAPSSMRRPRSTPSPRKTCRVQPRFPGSPDRCGRRRRRPGRLDAGWRRADDHSRATAARRASLSRRKCAITGRRRSTKTTGSSAAGGRPTDSVFAVGEPAGSDVWYPVNGHPRDKATYTLAITVPEPYDVVSNGLSTPSRGRPGPRATPRRSPTRGRTRSRRRAIS